MNHEASTQLKIAQKTLLGGKIKYKMLKYINIILFIIFFSLSIVYSNDIQKMVEYNKPSVVLVNLEINGVIVFKVPISNQVAMQELEDEITNLALSGSLGYTEEEIKRNIIKYMLNKISKDPNKYLVPSSREKRVEIRIGALGSGVIINPNGYVLTATHVVAMEEEEIKSIIINQFLDQVIGEDLFTSFENQIGMSISKEDEKLLSIAVKKYLIANIVGLDYEKKVYVILGVADKGKANIGIHLKPASIIKIGSSEKISDIVNMGRDLAIVKIDQTNLPTSLIAEQEPTEGSEVVVVGYPATVHVFWGWLFDHHTILKPTITKGIISSIRTSNKGVRVIQTDATTNKGNSGGPGYNSEGKIIGTVSWGLLDPRLGVSTKNYAILVSCSEIQNFIKEANIQNIQSDVDKNYQKGIDEYYQQRYRSALNYFKKVQDLYPDHPYVKEYIINCQTNISQGKDRSGITFDNNTTIILLIAFGILSCGALVFLIGAFVFYFFFFRKKASKNN